MKVGTILLTKSNKYVDADGNLPKRPSFDKELLRGLVSGKRVSGYSYLMLPPSIQKLCYCKEFGSEEHFPISIKELAQTELLIVIRSTEEFSRGKEFKFDNFKCLAKDRRIELWITQI